MDCSTPFTDQPALGFASDNNAGASPEILQAMLACNGGQLASYGADALSARVTDRLCELFEREVSVFLVPTGTAANALCLAAMTPPWGQVLCHPGSHINNDECGAPEFYSAGARLVTVDGADAKIDAEALRVAANNRVGDVHSTQSRAVSITQATEIGTVYTLAELENIGEICRSSRLHLHMDGSRFANAVAALGCTPAQMTWKAGVEALSFGATKNGAVGVEAIVLFNPALAEEVAFRRKRAGHLFSKMRFLAAQMDAYLHNDLWLANARQANTRAQQLIAGLRATPGVGLIGTPTTNIVFARLPLRLQEALLAEGFVFYTGRWEPGVVRFVTSFATTERDVAHFVTRMQHLASTLA